MSCPEELELFLLREGTPDGEGDGEGLSPEREKEVADHVASCADCQAKLAELEALGAALAEPQLLSEGRRAAFVSEVIQKIDAQDPAPAPMASEGGRSRFWLFGVPIAAAACCGLLALIVIPSTFMLSAGGEAEMATVAEQSAVAERSAFDSASPEQPFAAAPSQVEAPAPPAAQGFSDEPLDVRALGGPAEEGESGGLNVRRRALTGSGHRAKSARRPARPTSERAKRGRGESDLDALLDGAIGGGGRRGRPTPAPQIAASPTKSAPGGRRGSANAWGGSPDRMAPAAAQPPRPSSIDPNGRFATTYRPGRGHLTRFETALFRRSNVPEPALELVAEAGRGSGPEVAPPAEQALALDIRPGMTRVDPAGGPVHLALTLRSTASEPASRPDVAVHLVMDTSGSMMGEAIEHAKQAARQLVGMLEARDRFSLVSYSTGAEVVTVEGPVGSRRSRILQQIDELRARGGTNLEAGLRLGYEQAQGSPSRDDLVRLVIVLSDGQPNQGITNPLILSEMSAAAFQSGVETTTIGVGDSYEPQVMSTLAEYGAGGYYYLPDASTIEQVLRAELDVRTQPVARGVELRVWLGDGVELLEAYGSRRLNQVEAQRVRRTEVAIDHQEAERSGIARDRQEDRQGGMRFFIPGFARDDQHTILLRLRAPEGSAGAELALADVELRYKDRVLTSNQADERRVTVAYAEDRAAALATLDADVRRVVYSFRTGQALMAVSSRLSRGQQTSALALLYERAELLRRAGDELDDSRLRAEAGRLDAFRTALTGQGMNNQLMMGALLQRAGSGRMR